MTPSILAVLLVLAAAGFLAMAGYGMFALPDVLRRASVTMIAGTLGVGCLLAAAAVHFAEPQVSARITAIAACLLLTTPVAVHMIARAAGVPLAEKFRAG